MKELQLFRDAAIEPTDERIAAGLGLANEAYRCFLEKLTGQEIALHWRYYNDGKAWLGKGIYGWTTRRGTQKETTAFWLSVWEGFFKVTLYVPEKYRLDALCLPLGGETKKRIADAKQMGKLKFFPLTFDVRATELLEELIFLINFRKVLK